MSKKVDVTKEMWDDYRRVQKSGSMNMMGHHDAMSIIPQWNALVEWFETEGMTIDYDEEGRKVMGVRINHRRKVERRVQLREELARLDAELGDDAI
tara:strand:- start:1325 stop:1612 length:288 start_codon:yes stop_codon:yes gene_type:complete